MKPKININYILGGCVLVMLVLCLLSVWQPMRFDSQRTEREKLVKQRLETIRGAEEKYRQKNGVYTANWNTLVKERYISAQMQFIPYSDGKRFHLAATVIVGKSGKQTPLMECGATYADYLDGMDADAIEQLTEQANYAGLYPGLKIGEITTDNSNAGNW